jgi:hypothetical protein
MGLIAGAVGIAVVFFVGLAFFLARRHRRKKKGSRPASFGPETTRATDEYGPSHLANQVDTPDAVDGSSDSSIVQKYSRHVCGAASAQKSDYLPTSALFRNSIGEAPYSSISETTQQPSSSQKGIYMVTSVSFRDGLGATEVHYSSLETDEHQSPATKGAAV